MNDFFNPKSMSTPGAAGALIVVITNTLANTFPEVEARYVALSLSFMFGAVVFTAAAMRIWERGIYWVINSLIIFSMSFGANNMGLNLQEPEQTEAPQANASTNYVRMVASSAMLVFGSNAYAQDPSTIANPDRNPARAVPVLDAEMQRKIEDLKAQINQLQQDNQRLKEQQVTPSPTKPKTRSFFFKKW